MRTIFAEYNPQCNSIDVYTSAGYMLRIDCWETEKDLKTTPGSDCALNTLAIDEPLEYARLYLDGNLQMWVDAEDSLELSSIDTSELSSELSRMVLVVFSELLVLDSGFEYSKPLTVLSVGLSLGFEPSD